MRKLTPILEDRLKEYIRIWKLKPSSNHTKSEIEFCESVLKAGYYEDTTIVVQQNPNGPKYVITYAEYLNNLEFIYHKWKGGYPK